MKLKIGIVSVGIIFLLGGFNTSGNKQLTVYTIGDSTVKNGDGSGKNKQWGWGDFLEAYFDTNWVQVKNQAIGGRSSRTFLEEGRWQTVYDQLKPGDYVLIQFGHNDGGSLNTDRARGTLKGTGEETKTVIMEATGKENTIHTYGWYIRKYVREAKEKGAIPIVVSPIPRNIWKDGTVERNNESYGKWSKEVSEQEKALFIDLNDLVARKYESLGENTIGAYYFEGDHTHTSLTGAILNAKTVAEAIRGMETPLAGYVKNEPSSSAQRKEFLLEKNWKFVNKDIPEAKNTDYKDKEWQQVIVPHDWAIYGPFDRKHDLQNVAVTQNGEKVATAKTGRTGGLPYAGVGWYRTVFNIDRFDKETSRVNLLFDGAMSEARIFVNGQEVCFWPYGYNSFYCDVTNALNNDGKNNLLAVRLENQPESSRWYPGAGLYRNVHVIQTPKTHVPVWGTYITTPYVSKEYASVNLKTSVDNAEKEVRIVTEIRNVDGNVVAQKDNTQKINHGSPLEQNFTVYDPKYWSPENPYLYVAVSRIYSEGVLIDEYTTRFGIRDIRLVADKGFFLNGERRKFRGVCNHHDLGPLGAAINEAALRRQLTLLKDMGCDAIRTSHNMPAPELVSLCDEMGFMMIVENFDEWERAKCKNGYHRFFNEWAEKDMVNMLHHFRNHPSVVMWSIGNEVPTQCSTDGYKVATFLQDICHREDPTRPVTCGMDQVSCVLNNGFAALLDIPGFNYRTERYAEAYKLLPQNLVLGSETSSTVSSRGIYKFPAEKKANAIYEDHQSSSYDLEYCFWSNIPEEDFALADDYEWTLGQFVWTGFDYLGEPTPYDTDAWPNHSSMFGIIDLASIPKDRYYLYRSIWNTKSNTLHILPHWNWEGREGETTPVFVYTNHPSAEVFINGKSQGKHSKNNDSLLNRYRLMWMDTRYEPGELKVVAYDENGVALEEKTIKTAGKPDRIELIPDRNTIKADGKDLAYIHVRIVDKDGNLCPHDNRILNFQVKGAGNYRAVANGDPTCLDLFHIPRMPAFNGQLTAIIQAGEKSGEIYIEANAKGLKGGKIILTTEQN